MDFCYSFSKFKTFATLHFSKRYLFLEVLLESKAFVSLPETSLPVAVENSFQKKGIACPYRTQYEAKINPETETKF